MPKIGPEHVATALGASQTRASRRHVARWFSLRKLDPEMRARLRSTGGRPGLEGAKKPMRIPVREEDANRLGEIADQLAEEGVHATAGQVGSVLIQEALSQVEDLRLVELDKADPLEKWIDRPNFSVDLRRRLKRANILLIPLEERGDVPGPLFTLGIPDLFQYLQDHAPTNLSVEICAGEEDYREVARYSALVLLGGFVVTSIAAPVLVNLLSEYLKRRLGSREASADVRTEIILRDEEGTTSIRMRYKGPATAFRSETLAALSQAKRALRDDRPSRKKRSRRKK